MQLYVAAIVDAQTPTPDLVPPLLAAAAFTPQLDPSTCVVEHSATGRVAVARISHADTVAAPRRYAARERDRVTVYDGFPIERHGRFPAHDAAVLGERWADAPGALEGTFSALHVDLAADTVECLTDVLGMAPVFLARAAGLMLVGNAVETLRLLTRAKTVDRLGLASLIALGWPAAGRTLLADVTFLAGGTLHRLSAAGHVARPLLTPAIVRDAKPPSRSEMTEQLRATALAATQSDVPLTSALSSGRDTRVLLALLRASGATARYYTSGTPGDLDTETARIISARWGLDHRIHYQDPSADLGRWADETTAFVGRNDGLSSLEAVSDHLDHTGTVDRLPLEFWGAAGEIGRKVKWVASSLAGLTPGARRLHTIQRALLLRGISSGGGLLRPAAREHVVDYLDGFIAQRRAEGWPAEDLIDVFYAFGRVRHWSARGVRRASATADLFTPFASYAYIVHCLHLPVGARYVEQPPRDLILRLSPEVDIDPYEFPWRRQRPRAAFALVVAEGARRVARRRLGTEIAAHGADFGPGWFETGLPIHAALARRTESSPLWELVDRDRYLSLLSATPEERGAVAAVLSRTLTALWWLHGRPGAPMEV